MAVAVTMVVSGDRVDGDDGTVAVSGGGGGSDGSVSSGDRAFGRRRATAEPPTALGRLPPHRLLTLNLSQTLTRIQWSGNRRRRRGVASRRRPAVLSDTMFSHRSTRQRYLGYMP